MKNPISNTLKYGEYLLGSLISHNNITGIISEVEAYIGPEDKASHCHNNRKTKRTERKIPKRVFWAKKAGRR